VYSLSLSPVFVSDHNGGKRELQRSEWRWGVFCNRNIGYFATQILAIFVTEILATVHAREGKRGGNSFLIMKKERKTADTERERESEREIVACPEFVACPELVACCCFCSDTFFRA